MNIVPYETPHEIQTLRSGLCNRLKIYILLKNIIYARVHNYQLINLPTNPKRAEPKAWCSC